MLNTWRGVAHINVFVLMFKSQNINRMQDICTIIVKAVKLM